MLIAIKIKLKRNLETLKKKLKKIKKKQKKNKNEKKYTIFINHIKKYRNLK